MDFEEIEELNEEDMNALYNDIIEFGDEAHLAGCYCKDGARIGYHGSSNSCRSWCWNRLSCVQA